MRIVIVTGMSGAGKSSALKIFEDMSYYSMDNLPPKLLMNFLELARSSKEPIERVAVGMDIRGGQFFDDLVQAVHSLENEDVEVSILYLMASDEILVRRYKELRRPHPMDKAGNIYDGIQRERSTLRTVHGIADHVLDTSTLTLGQLKNRIEALYRRDANRKLLVTFVSFGFKHGILIDADLIFDVRFLPNPYYVADLKERTGLDEPVRDYVIKQDETTVFLEKTKDFLTFLIPHYIREGKSTLTVGLGCTGGRHRSVVLAEELGYGFAHEKASAFVKHRDQRFW